VEKSVFEQIGITGKGTEYKLRIQRGQKGVNGKIKMNIKQLIKNCGQGKGNEICFE